MCTCTCVRMCSQSFPVVFCSRESLIASISRPESTVSKLFEPRAVLRPARGKRRVLEFCRWQRARRFRAKQLPREIFRGNRRKPKNARTVNCTFASMSKAGSEIAWQGKDARYAVDPFFNLHDALSVTQTDSPKHEGRRRFDIIGL